MILLHHSRSFIHFLRRVANLRLGRFQQIIFGFLGKLCVKYLLYGVTQEKYIIIFEHFMIIAKESEME